MHLLNKLDKHLHRKKLAEEAGINYVYLSSLVYKGKLSPDVEEKLKKAVKKIIRQLSKAIGD